MRTQSGKLIIDLGDSISEAVTGSFTALGKTTIDENATRYNLYPALTNNKGPRIVKNIYDASIPPIIREEVALSSLTTDFTTKSTTLYLSADGIVKAVKGSDFTLSIQAEQPQDILVTNGVPQIDINQDALAYVWSKDGVAIPNGTGIILDGGGVNNDLSLATSYIKAENNNLIFFNILPTAGGNFACEIRNNAGSVQSETINIQVYNPESLYDSSFFKNIIVNPYATSGTEGWVSMQGNIKANSFDASGDQTLKEPQTPKSGFTPQQFYPYPSNITSPLALGQNLDVWKIAANQANYFTRDKLDYLSNGGLRKVVVYQDIDLAAVSDYIRGGVFGVDGVRAFFGCYLGNALFANLPPRDLVKTTERYSKKYYFQGAPRISVENFLWAGPMTKSEAVSITIQELEDEELLISRIIQKDNRIVDVKGITLDDPLTRAFDEVRRLNQTLTGIQSSYSVDKYKVGYTLKPSDKEDIIIRAYQSLYREIDNYYSHGQYVEYNTVHFERLNKRTNKIRINLIFDLSDDRFYEYKENASGLLDLLGWDKAHSRGTFRSQLNQSQWNSAPFYGSPQVNPDNKNFLADQSKTLVTGLNFSIFPISKTSNKLIGQTPIDFKNNAVIIPTREQDITNRPITKPPLVGGLTFNKGGFTNV